MGARALLAATLALSGLTAVATPASAAASWSPIASPSPPGPPTGTLTAVSCPSATACFAVGSSGLTPLAVHWNGTTWSVVPTGGIGSGGFLDGVACASTTSCLAVGAAVTGTALRPLAEQWNGTTWTLVTTPTPTGATNSDLSGIACVSATSCTAVGVSTVAGIEKTLVERWNGTTWSIIASPNPTGSTGSNLDAVACTSSTSCFAVGSWETASGSKTLTERWNGTSWSLVTTPKPTGATRSNLIGVTCASTTSCFAVGNWDGASGTRTLAQRWNGTTWTLVTTPTPTGMVFGGLTGVGCASTTSCFAVGISDNRALVERWNGTSWTIVATPPAPTGTTRHGLLGVACTSTTSCLTVGYSVGGGDGLWDYAPLVERWNGTTWAISPPPMDGSESVLVHVACVSTTNCFAVGSYDTGSATKPLVERWNGTTWSTVTIPIPIGTTNNSLAGVACPSTNRCIAVGSSDNKPLVERWNGTTWTVMATPTPTGATSSSLSAIDCASTTSCFAVGNWDGASGTKTLTERWNGTGWSLVTTPKPAGAANSSLSAIDCASTTSCFAVGNWDGASGFRTLAQRWNGTTWTLVDTPIPFGGMIFGDLTGLSCASTTSCFAVGFNFSGMNIEPLVEHWNGTTWSFVTTPTPPLSTDSGLTGVSCTSTTSCFAVGINFTGATDQPWLEHWDGTSWTLMATPTPPGATRSVLAGVTCTSATSCFAVGASSTGAYWFTLIERYA